MRMYECHACGGMCDPGELESGVCFDCRREASERFEERKLGIRKSINQMMQEWLRQQKDGQMVMRV